MARENLFDDSGYIGFEECSRYEECSKEAYKKGKVDAIDEYINLVKSRCDDDKFMNEYYVGLLEQLKEK